MSIPPIQPRGSFRSLSSVSRGRRRGEEGDEEEVEIWAALEKLPTYNRMRTTVLERLKGSRTERRQVDLKDVNTTQYLMNQLFKLNDPNEDNEIFLRKLRQRIERVGIELPKIEVRYDNLTVKGKVHVGSRALPTLLNTILNFGEDLLVNIGLSLGKKEDLTILHGASGILKPGRMTLLLGPPSAGKTTLLLALSGLLDPDLKVEGKITFNGFTFDEFVPQKTAAYISQNDLHQAELTVRETMEFSARYQGIGTRYDLITELITREKERGIVPDPDTDFFMKAIAMEDLAYKIVTEYYMKIMGLDVCADSLVGDQMRRGISGGQQKRLTTGEMMVGPARAFFMDEISTGLDSSTTFQVVKCLGQAAHLTEIAILVSLLQPAPETYDLFDDIILIAAGQIVYHGPRERIEEFFASCGMKCPPRKGIADFLQEVTSLKDQEQYWADKSKPYRFIPVKEFSEAFKKFDVGQKLHEDLAKPFDKTTSLKGALVLENWSLPQWDLFKITFEREWLLFKRTRMIPIFFLFQSSIIAILASSLFFRTETHHRNLDDVQIYGGLTSFLLNFCMLSGYSEIVMTAVRFPVFHKYRLQQCSPPWTWALSIFILKAPFIIIQSTVFLALTYYPTNLAPGFSRFAKMWLIFVLSSFMASALFRALAAFCKTIVVSNSLGGFALQILVVLGGFVIPRTDIRAWWIWGYWASPLSYAQNSAANVEFLDDRWRRPIPNDTHTVGHRYILSLGLFDRGYWFWLGCGAQIGFAIFFNMLFAWSITYLSPPEKSRAMVSKEGLAERRVSRVGGADVGNYLIKSGGRGSLSRRLKSMKSSEDPMEPGSGADIQIMEGPSGSSRSLPHRSSSLPSNSSLYSSASEVDEQRGMILSFQPLAISFNNINYYVDMPEERKALGATEDKLHLLTGITGSFRPGVLTALVGITGAGKSTLMDVLAGRKTIGHIEGDIRISGFPKNLKTFPRISGYCEQNDIHSPQITVYESLLFSAWLRLERGVDDETKTEFVQEVMDLVELTPLRNALVGVPGQTGLSTEQRKRLTIAVELVANPSIIFMDEPTSGLDARAAATVMRAVRNTVDTGRTVVCTIHQPSIDIFEAFDERGGETIYAGPLGRHSIDLIRYFEGINGIPKIKEGINPAAWMLEVTTPGMEAKLGVNFAELYRNSRVFKDTQALVDELSKPPPNGQDISFPNRYPQSAWTQFECCLWKQNLTYWRSPGYNLMRFCLSLGAALLTGTMMWGLGHKVTSQRNLFTLMGGLYATQLFYGILTASAVQPLIDSERTVFYRERSAGMYSELPYAFAQCLIEIPYVFASSSLFIVLIYAMIKLEWDAGKFFWFLYFAVLLQLCLTFAGMMMVAVTPNPELAALMLGLCFNLWSLFSGFMITKPNFPPWWDWIYWANPVSYSIYGLFATQFGDVTTLATSQSGSTETVKELIKQAYGFRHSYIGFVASMSLLWPMISGATFVLSIKFLNHQRR